jgi:hypothetical protein
MTDDLKIPDILRRTPEPQAAPVEPDEEPLEELEARITTLMGNDVANRIELGKALRKVQAKLKDKKLWLDWIEKMGYGQRQVYRCIATADGADRVDRLVDNLSTRCIADVLPKIEDFSDDVIKRAAELDEGRINYDLLRNIQIPSRCQYRGDDLPDLCVLHLKPPVGMAGPAWYLRSARNHQAR